MRVAPQILRPISMVDGILPQLDLVILGEQEQEATIVTKVIFFDSPLFVGIPSENSPLVSGTDLEQEDAGETATGLEDTDDLRGLDQTVLDARALEFSFEQGVFDLRNPQI